jgi:hypothetical protein
MARFEGESGGEKKEEEDEALMLTFPVASGGFSLLACCLL